MTTSEAVGPAQARLHLADGVEFIGEMAGSGYRVPPCLVRRADGQTIQLTPLLYAVLREIDDRTPAEVAVAVSESTGRGVSEDNVRQIVDEKLRRLGVLVMPDGSQPSVPKRSPLLGLRFRHAIADPNLTRKLTNPFRFLFHPSMAAPVLAAFAVVCWWVFFRKGLASAAYEAFERPGLLILVFVVTVLSAGFHEFGHAAAARYGGATPGVMGFGLYLLWPAFYADVTDSYRLGRARRLRTDLGGLYFNAIVAVAISGLWLVLRYDALLLVVATQILQMLRQLAPMVRFDGYHVLADLTGVPDLYSRIKPTLLGVLPWNWGNAEARALKPWARAVVTTWVLVVVPLLLCTLWVTLLALPRVLGTAWSSLAKQQHVLAVAWGDGDVVQAAARVLSMIAIIVPVGGTIYLLIRMARRTSARAWQRTSGKPMARGLVLVAASALVTAIACAWCPHRDNYRPIQPWERGTAGDIAYALKSDPLSAPVLGNNAPEYASPALVTGQKGVMQALWDKRDPLPTKDAPKLAVIMVPRGSGSSGGSTDQGWVFPVSKPLAPGPGDNQALAVNTTDNTTVYDAAFAMVYADAGDATNTNGAYAYASCNSCEAVAVSYQVVFVMDKDNTDNNVAAPVNVSQSINHDCVNCMTYSVAEQVFITLDKPLTPQQKIQLAVIWMEMQVYQREVEAGLIPPDQIPADLDRFTERIVDVVEPNIATTNAPQTSSQSDSQSDITQSPQPSAAVAPAPTTEPTAPTGGSLGGTTGGATTAVQPPATGDSTSDGSTSDGTSDGSTSGGATSGGFPSGP